MSVDRVALLERYGRVYGELGLAVAFTRSVEGEDAKRCGTGWDSTQPLADGPFGAGLLKERGQKRNPAVVLRASGLVGLECDTVTGLKEILALNLPQSVLVQSSAPERLHFWFRPPNGKVPEFVAFRFEKAGITADRGRYLLAPPSIHPSGAVYRFLNSPEDTEIATLPADAYAELVRQAEAREHDFREQLKHDPDAKITEGKRRETIFRFACSQRAYGIPPETIRDAAFVLNRTRCEPPLSDRQVADQVKGALEYEAGTTLPAPAIGGEGGLAWTRLSEIEMRSIVFLDRPLLQADAFHLLAGRKGVGKGTYIADVAARITRGELGPKRNVVWIASEDSAAIDIKPRVVAANGNPELIANVTDWLQLPRDDDKLRHTIAQFSDVGLVVIDPVGNHITGKDSNSDTDIRDAIAPLNALADELQTMVLGIRHLSEKDCKAGAIAAILGASAWVQVPRAVLAIARDNDDAHVSHVQCIAGNRLPPDTPGRAFRIVATVIEGLENEVTRAHWIGNSTKDVESLLEQHAGKKTSRSDIARELILDALEAAPLKQIESDALDARVAAEVGITAKTVQNLRTELKDKGLVKFYAERDEGGEIARWIVTRTNAPRQIPALDGTGFEPDPGFSVSEPENGSTMPDPDHLPYTQESGCSEQEPLDPEISIQDVEAAEPTSEGRGQHEEIPLGDEPLFESKDFGELAPLPSWVITR